MFFMIYKMLKTDLPGVERPFIRFSVWWVDNGGLWEKRLPAILSCCHYSDDRTQYNCAHAHFLKQTYRLVRNLCFKYYVPCCINYSINIDISNQINNFLFYVDRNTCTCIIKYMYILLAKKTRSFFIMTIWSQLYFNYGCFY